jgi:hypothetical protein
MQYTHTITFTTTTGSYQDADGNWIEGSSIPESYPARCEPVGFGTGSSVKAVNGERVQLDWVVYIPLPVSNIGIDTRVTITMNGVSMTDTVKRFSKGLFNARVWL